MDVLVIRVDHSCSTFLCLQVGFAMNPALIFDSPVSHLQSEDLSMSQHSPVSGLSQQRSFLMTIMLSVSPVDPGADAEFTVLTS